MAEIINEETLDQLEKKVEDLRNMFEQYFMGARKRAPEQERTTVQFQIRRMSNQTINSTKLRFKFQQLTAKFNSYNQYWNRTLQKIESGTYFRDQFKAKLHAKPDPGPPPTAGKKKAAGGGGGSEIDALHKELVNARKSLNQSTNVSKEKLEQTIKQQMPKLQERYKGKEVKFKVVVENGQAKLKATVK